METVRFHIAQMMFFLRTFFSHSLGPSEQFDTQEKLSSGCKQAKLAADLDVRRYNVVSVHNKRKKYM